MKKLLSITFGLLSAHLDAQTASFSGLGDLPGGLTFSMASDISGDGKTVIGMSYSRDDHGEAYYWNPKEGMKGIGDLPGGVFSSQAEAVSYDGSVIVGGSFSTDENFGQEAFRWTKESGMQPLGELPGGIFRSAAFGVSADGNTIVGLSNNSQGGDKAIRWTTVGGMEVLADAAGAATFISADGTVIAGQIYRIINGVYSPFPESIDAISGDGKTVTGIRFVSGLPSNYHTYVWSELTGFLTIPSPTGSLGIKPYDISKDGSVIVGNCTQDGEMNAALWRKTTGTSVTIKSLLSDHGIDTTGWKLQYAFGVSDDGNVIAGWGKNPDGNYEAWIAHTNLVAQPITTKILRDEDQSLFFVFNTQSGFYYDVQRSVDLETWASSSHSIPGIDQDISVPLVPLAPKCFVRVVRDNHPHAPLQPAALPLAITFP